MAFTSPNHEKSSKKTKRPKESAFFQQKLPGCRPLLTPRPIITIYTVIGLILIPIGIYTLQASKKVVEVVYRYDNICARNVVDRVEFIQNPATNKTCPLSITIPKHMKKPIYVYYELDNYHQNHRRYAKSKSYTQLSKGDNPSDASNCKPERYLLNNSSYPIIPCGLVAWSLFNDTYSLSTNGATIPISKTGISWKSDRHGKFGSKVYPQNFPNNDNGLSGVLVGGAGLDSSRPINEDEDLMVWMRTAAFPNFRKLYGRIEQDLSKNTIIHVTILNVYNTYSFHGKKKLVLSTTSSMGGKNDFLGIAYITVGCISLLLAILFLVIYLKRRRPLGDLNQLSWNQYNIN